LALYLSTVVSVNQSLGLAISIHGPLQINMNVKVITELRCSRYQRSADTL